MEGQDDATDYQYVVVGSGIAGLSAAYHLAAHDAGGGNVLILEASSIPGGHSRTVTLGEERIDLGFQVFNRETYPVLCSIYEELNVKPVASSMSFATSDPTIGALKHSAELMPYLKWLWRDPKQFVQFIMDKRRFHHEAAEAMARPESSPATLGAFFKSYSRVFFDGWISPFTSAVWSLEEKSSSASSSVAEFDLQVFLRFMQNHGFLSWSTFQWLTLPGGAQEEVDAFLKYFAAKGNVSVRCNARVSAWEQGRLSLSDGSIVKAKNVIFACHAPQAREILGNSTPKELLAFETTKSTVYLHRDVSFMPKDRTMWAAWNVVDGAVTYWLKEIQSCRVHTEELFVTVIADKAKTRTPKKIEQSDTWFHPRLQHGVVPLQRRLLQGFPGKGIYFAGAWLRYGFHEDGAYSGAMAARQCLKSTQVPILRPSNHLQRLAGKIWIADESSITHASQVGSKHSFSYRIPEQVVVDLENLPQYWWGGVLNEDHYNGQASGHQLAHVIPKLVASRLDGFFPIGRVHLVTTMRAFGQVNNPISIYVCWGADESLGPEAFVYEVQNYPWGETTTYVLDARQGQREWKFVKTLHVSPWHPHPLERDQYYKTRIEFVLAGCESDIDSGMPPFQSMRVHLDLYDSKTDICSFKTTWTINQFARRFPRPIPVGLLTAKRILGEAVALSTTRPMYPNISNPNAPVGFQTMLLTFLVLLFVTGWRGSGWILFASLIASHSRMSPVPLLHDIWRGMLLAWLALVLIG